MAEVSPDSTEESSGLVSAEATSERPLSAIHRHWPRLPWLPLFFTDSWNHPLNEDLVVFTAVS